MIELKTTYQGGYMPKLTTADKMRKSLDTLKTKAMKIYEDIEALELLVNNLPETNLVTVASTKVKTRAKNYTKADSTPKQRGRPPKAKAK